MPGRKQTIARLVTEFVIIVVGVLVALAVDQAADSAGERRIEHNYLRRLVLDLRADSAWTDRLIFRWGTMQSGAEAVLPVLENAAVPITDSVGFAVEVIQAAMQASWTPAEGATFEELVSTGRLGLLSDYGLRADLLDYYRQDARREAFVNRLDLTYRRLLQQIGGPEVWWPAFDCYVRRNEAEEADPFDCHPAIPRAALERFVTGLRGNPDAAALLRQRLVDLGTLNNWFRERLSRQAELLTRLESAAEPITAGRLR